MSFLHRPDGSGQSELQEEFLRLLLPLRDRLSHYARAVARTREEADDLVSDTILAALEGFPRLRDRTVFASYLFRIASRLQKRRRWRRKLFGEYDEDHALAIGSSDPSPEMAAEIVMLHRALARLPDAQREAVVFFELGGLSLEEIREIQGGSLSGVKSRISRGRQELGRLLGAHEGGSCGRATRGRIEKEAGNGASTANGIDMNRDTRAEAALIYSGPQING